MNFKYLDSVKELPELDVTDARANNLYCFTILNKSSTTKCIKSGIRSVTERDRRERIGWMERGGIFIQL